MRIPDRLRKLPRPRGGPSGVRGVRGVRGKLTAGVATAAIFPAVALLSGPSGPAQAGPASAEPAGVLSNCDSSGTAGMLASPAPQAPVNSVITLVTGDKVRVQSSPGGGLTAAPIRPAGGAQAPVFTRFNVAGDQYLVPADAVPYLGSLLDPRLFDVSYLERAGLDDAHTGSLPLTVSAAPGRAALPGIAAATGKEPAGTAMLAKSQATALGALLAAGWRDAHAGRALPAGDPLAGVTAISLAQPAGGPPLPPLPQNEAQEMRRTGTPPKYWTLTVNLIGQDGKPGTGVGYAQDLDDSRYGVLEEAAGVAFRSVTGEQGPLRFSVPAGTFSLVFTIVTPHDGTWDGVDAALTVNPQVTVNGNTTVTLDARTAVPYQVTAPPGVSTTDRMDQIIFTRTAGGATCQDSTPEMALLSVSAPDLYTGTQISATPTAPATLGTAGFLAATEMYPADFESASARPNPGPRYYLLFPHADGIPSVLSYQVPQDQLETIHEHVFISPGCLGSGSLLGGPQFNPVVYTPWGDAVGMGEESSTGGLPPGDHVDYIYSSDPREIRWQNTMTPECDEVIADNSAQQVVPGGSVSGEWDQGPQVPSPSGGGAVDFGAMATSPFGLALDVAPAARQDDLAFLNLMTADSDPAHISGQPMPYPNGIPSYLAFWRNGDPVTSSAALGATGPTMDGDQRVQASGAVLPMLHQAASYKLQYWTGRDYDTAGTTDTVWTFQSGPSDGAPVPSSLECGPDPSRGCSYLPLLFLTYHLALGADSQATAGTPFQVTFTAEHQQGEPAPAGVSATVSASFDGGKTWTAAVPASSLGGNQFTAQISQPALSDTDGYVALQVHATDSAGNTVTQTIIRAYALTS